MLVISLKIREKVKVFFMMKIKKSFMKENSEIITWKEKVRCFIQMVQSMKGNSKKESQMDKELNTIQMEIKNTKVNLLKINMMVKEHYLMNLDRNYMKVILRLINTQDMANYLIRMALLSLMASLIRMNSLKVKE